MSQQEPEEVMVGVKWAMTPSTPAWLNPAALNVFMVLWIALASGTFAEVIQAKDG